MTGIPDAETAWREWMGVHETGVDPRPMSGAMVAALKEVFDAGFAAASGPWADSTFHSDECMDAHMLPCRCGADGRRARKAEADLAAALARNAELEAELRGIRMNGYETAYSDAVRRADAARAELDNLRDRVTETEWEPVATHAEWVKIPTEDAGCLAGQYVRRIVRGSDDEAGEDDHADTTA